MARRAYHHGDLRNALLDAAAELVAERGTSGFTMADAARRAGVSSGAPYRHFADRSDLLGALAVRAHQALLARIEAATAGAPSPTEAFRRTGVALVAFAAENPALFQVMNLPEHGDRIDTEAPAAAEWWQAVAARIRSGEPLAPDDPAVAVLAGQALAHGLAWLFVSGQFGRLGIGPEYAEALAEAVTAGAGGLPTASWPVLGRSDSGD